MRIAAHGRRGIAAAISALLCAGSLHAVTPDRAVRIALAFEAPRDPSSLGGGPRFVTGNTVPANLIITILFTKEPCPLPIEGAAGMLRAWQALAAYQVGCWYPTVDDLYVTIDGLGNARASGAYWEIYPRALLHPDGSATITEQNYDSATFIQKVANEKAMGIFSRMHEKP